jgi:hypothetical protein
MSAPETEAIDALLKLSLPCDTNLELPAIRPQERTNVSLPNLSSIFTDPVFRQRKTPLLDDEYVNSKRNFLKSLSRAATIVRPYKKKAASIRTELSSCSSSILSDTASVKPRWQDSERLDLLEAIVKDKKLDDMKTIRWDRIAVAVGKAKKACKDQWRREILPNLMKNLKSSKYKA